MTQHECGLEVTYCGGCGAELEAGQVGKCEDCDPPTFEFGELSEAAKQKARDAHRGEDYMSYDWWDGVYEDTVHVAAILGIDIDARTTELHGGGFRRDPCIYFSGFWSQGDGACFVGQYRFNPKAVEEISAETKDDELIRIATQLYTLQLTRRLLGLAPFSAQITRGSGSNYYGHSGTMDVEVNSEDENDEHSNVGEDLEDSVTQLMRDFADWIYESLEAEYDWLTSDAVVDEALAEETFDETGSII